MKRYDRYLILFFLIPIVLLSVLAIVLPEKDVSQQENRTLAKRPAFSMSALGKGTYTREYETYFSDQIPFRNGFLWLSQKVTDLFTIKGKDGVEIVDKPTGSGDLGAGETLQTDGDAPPPSAVPTPAPVNIEGQDIEDKGTILIVGDRAMETYTKNDAKIKEYAAIISRMQEAMPETKVYSLAVPTSISFYSPEKYHSMSASQKDAIALLYDNLENSAKGIDAYSYLAAAADQYIYFRTDHHWTARGAYAAYTAFSKEAGFTPKPLDQFETKRIDGFVGTMYRYTQNENLKNNPDFVEIFMPDEPEVCNAYQTADMVNPVAKHPIYTQLDNTDNKYLAFLGGDHPLLHVVTPHKNGKKILLVKDSYGNAFAPFLFQDYEEVYIIDPRSITMNLPSFVAQHGIGEVIFENYTFAVTNKAIMDGLNKLLQ